MRPVTDVAVRSPAGVSYVCDRLASGAWRCGHCQLGRVTDPVSGARCPACQAEVVATRRGLSAAHLVALGVLLVALGWIVLNLWR